jgi:hypothetical protein
MRVTMRVDGLNQALANIQEWTEEKKQAVKAAIDESALNIQTGAKQNLTSNGNIDTGSLRARIFKDPVTSDNMTLKVWTNVEYAPYVEWGTGIYATHPTIAGRSTPWAVKVSEVSKRKTYGWPTFIGEDGEKYYLIKGAKPHPFLFPAAEAERPNYLRNIEEALKQ